MRGRQLGRLLKTARSTQLPSSPGSGITRVPSVLAPQHEREYAQGVRLLAAGRPTDAFPHFERVHELTAPRVTSGCFFAGFCLYVEGSANERAIEYLYEFLRSGVALPDELMIKYAGGVEFSLVAAPGSEQDAQGRVDRTSAVLFLVSLLSREERLNEAIEVMEANISADPEPVERVFLVGLYADTERWDNVIAQTEGVRNDSNAGCELVIYRAIALAEKGLYEGSLSLLKEALRYPTRQPNLLRAARYERALAYEALGRSAMARRELERIYAEDSGYRDVRNRLSKDEA